MPLRLVRGDREVFGLRGRSAEQRIALDLLLDPDIGIVSLGGRAGTGKSALALHVEDHETACSTLDRLGFTLFTEKDLDDQDELS